MNLMKKSTIFRKLVLVFALLTTGNLVATDYQVELIVFEHLNTIPSPEGETRLELKDEYRNLVKFNRVQREDFQLRDEANKIRGSRNFRLLQHFAWSQEGLSKDKARSVSLSRWIPGVRGKATLYLSRYLHLDILMQRENTEGVMEVLEERRRMRSNETHYIDHPTFGIIARITPIKDIENNQEK